MSIKTTGDVVAKYRGKLRANAVLEFAFPNLPNTLAGLSRRRAVTPRMVVKLPVDYSPDAAFPVFTFLNGADGGLVTRADTGMTDTIAPARSYIRVTLPLFKKERDFTEKIGGILISALDDYPTMSKAYRAMIETLHAVVPNIDVSRSVFGGFSNGANAVALLLSAVDETVLGRNAGFFLLDGGAIILSHHKHAIRAKRILYMFGGSRKTAGRRALLDWADAYHRDLGNTHVEIFKMPDVEHAFPEKHIPDLHRWVSAAPWR